MKIRYASERTVLDSVILTKAGNHWHCEVGPGAISNEGRKSYWLGDTCVYKTN